MPVIYVDPEAVDAVETTLFMAGCEPDDDEMRRRYAHAVVLHLCDEGYEVVKNPDAHHVYIDDTIPAHPPAGDDREQ